MIYGRRRIDPGLVRSSKKRKWILDRGFQLHYTSYLTLAVSGTSLLILGTIFYFVNQNYQIFISLAFDTHPGLVGHLEREITWLRAFMITSFIVITFSTLILTLKMTRKLIEPLAQMERHMRKLLQGQWNIKDLHRPGEDFNELLSTYDYFYRSLRMMTESELEQIKKLSVDPANREAYAAWKSLLETKAQRLGVPLNQPKGPSLSVVASEESAEAKPLRRVS